MPGMSGRDTLIQIKNINSNLFVVALITSENECNNLLNEGFNDYLMKPISENEVNRIISNIK